MSKTLTDSQRAIIESLEMEFLNINSIKPSGKILNVCEILAQAKITIEEKARVIATNKMWDEKINNQAANDYEQLAYDLDELGIKYDFEGDHQNTFLIGGSSGLRIRTYKKTKDNMAMEGDGYEVIGWNYGYYASDLKLFDSLVELCADGVMLRHIKREANKIKK